MLRYLIILFSSVAAVLGTYLILMVIFVNWITWPEAQNEAFFLYAPFIFIAMWVTFFFLFKKILSSNKPKNAQRSFGLLKFSRDNLQHQRSI